jgi:signal transduction histidine kinase
MHETLKNAPIQNEIHAIIAGQIVLWDILHTTFRREVGGLANILYKFSHPTIQIALKLVGDAVDGIVGALIDLLPSGKTSSSRQPVEMARWETLVELGRTHRESQMLNRVTHRLLNTHDSLHMFEVLEEGILSAFHLRSLAIAAVNHQEGFVEVLRAYPTSHGTCDPVGWRYDLSHPDILCDVARTGRMEVIDGWDPRYHERIIGEDGAVIFRQRPKETYADQASFFIPLLHEGRAVGVVCTASTQASKSIVLREIERMRPFLHIARDILVRQQQVERQLVYQTQLRSLVSALTWAEERERRRIARDLHDSVGQNLALLQMKLSTLRSSGLSPAFSECLDEVWSLADQALQQTRSLTFDLSPPVLHEMGFGAAVEWLVEEVQKRHGLPVRLEGDDLDAPLDENGRMLLFRTVRELLMNVVRHARAHCATISIRREGDGLCIEVVDDGVGFDASGVALGRNGAGRFGLFSIRERLEGLGGRFDVASRPGLGTRVTLWTPLSCDRAAGP